MRNIDRKTGLFRRSSFITLVLAYLVILAGGVVRSTGSGMGCPDWPKCFGSWVPPTDISQLPTDYQKIYSEKRQAKNDKVAGYLDAFGYGKLAEQLRNDPSIAEEGEFNVTKTWIEYVNRLLGVAVGIAVIVIAFLSLRLFKHRPRLTYLSVFAVVLVGFQGWLGSIVVSSNLLPWMITVHMLAALVFVALLILMWELAARPNRFAHRVDGMTYSLVIVVLFLSLVQVALGTQVREHIDVIAKALGPMLRGQWAGQLDMTFYIHRSLSILVFLANLFLLLRVLKMPTGIFRNMTGLMMVLILVEIASGVALFYLGIPAVLQSVHLLIGSAIFGSQFYLLLLAERGRRANAVLTY